MGPGQIEMVEVAPRDGLQNEKTLIETADKIALIERAIAAGSRRIEVTSFVNPKAVPQMADAEAVCEGLPERNDVTFIGLVMNARGATRALATGRIDQLGAVAVSTDSFAMANQGQLSDESVAAAAHIIGMARAAGLSGQATIAASFGCPFEGEVKHSTVLAIAEELAIEAPEEIALADTIGVGTPFEAGELFGKLGEVLSDKIPMRAHFHNTRGTGIANAWEAWKAGVRVFDASLGGLGGCPFAPRATGNIATEDLIYMMARSGVGTGIDLEAAIAANKWFAGELGRELPSAVARAS